VFHRPGRFYRPEAYSFQCDNALCPALRGYRISVLDQRYLVLPRVPAAPVGIRGEEEPGENAIEIKRVKEF
jgi:hypothetical protein